MEIPPIPSIPSPLPQKTKHFTAVMVVALLLVGLLAGGLIAYAITYSDFNTKLTNLQNQIGYNPGGNTTTIPGAVYLLGDNVSLSNLYQQVKSSVVVIQDIVPQYSFFGTLAGYSLQQGSGFVASVDNQLVIVTNNHVIENALNETVTFADGDCLPSESVGCRSAS